jgi:hypothetical protein
MAGKPSLQVHLQDSEQDRAIAAMAKRNQAARMVPTMAQYIRQLIIADASQLKAEDGQ